MLRSDALILPLKKFPDPYRGISAKLYEYQAASKPILCISDGAPKEYIEKTGSGITIEPGDYVTLAKKILYLKNNKHISKKYGENGHQYVKDNLDILKIGLKMKDELMSIMR
jgi:glycosyltransferase involved in cell wall biosynthesis